MFSDPKYSFSVCQKKFCLIQSKVNIFHQIQPNYVAIITQTQQGVDIFVTTPSPRMQGSFSIQRRRKKRGKWGNDQFDHVTILKFWLKNSTIPIKCKSWTASTYSLKKYGSITAQTGAGQPRPSLWRTLGSFLDTSRHQQPTFRPLGGGLLLAFRRVSRVSGGK